MVRHRGFYRVRVSILLTVLAVVCLWACYDVRARKARTEWAQPIRVGLVLLERGNVEPNALPALISRAVALEERLAEEYARYQPGRPRMIEIVPVGPVHVDTLPPSDTGENFFERLAHAYRLWRYTEAVDRAASVPTHRFDSRIYLVAEPPKSSSVSYVEGFSEEGGRVGVTHVELDVSTVDLALFVVAHELLHTLGASDKYDATGRTRFPEGLPEPDRTPLFPQPGAEVMARNRVISATEERPPASLSELHVGRVTAQEIGWAD
jgi:hypothetical protein